MSLRLRRYIEILFSLVFWIGTYYLLIQSFAIESIEIEELDQQYERNIIYSESRILSIRLGLILKICFYYLNSHFLRKSQRSTPSLQYFVRLIPLFCLFQLLEVFKLIGIYTLDGIELWTNTIGLGLLQYILLTFLSYAHALLKKSHQDELHTIQLLEQKKSAELQALKSQINPHFLFNALNNLLSITNEAKNEKASKVITQLSDMMRFLLDDAGQNKIPLSKEVELIESYIAINQLRFDEGDEIDIQFSKNGSDGSKSIEPMILLPFVENAYKHGVHAFKPSFVEIELNLSQGNLKFEVRNSIHDVEKNTMANPSDRAGIGIKNVRNRLDIVYAGQYHLETIKQRNTYHIVLNLNL